MAYVKEVQDELTKNHKQRDNVEIITGFMPQILDAKGKPHKLCPVRSFENYLGHLNEKCNGLWQKPWPKNYKRGLNVWYESQTIGKNPISTFMSKLSKDTSLSKIYTYHSIRVTGTTNLTRSHYTPCQIMSITGHKSIQSLSIYQQVKGDEKMMMGMSLIYLLL